MMQLRSRSRPGKRQAEVAEGGGGGGDSDRLEVLQHSAKKILKAGLAGDKLKSKHGEQRKNPAMNVNGRAPMTRWSIFRETATLDTLIPILPPPGFTGCSISTRTRSKVIVPDCTKVPSSDTEARFNSATTVDSEHELEGAATNREVEGCKQGVSVARNNVDPAGSELSDLSPGENEKAGGQLPKSIMTSNSEDASGPGEDCERKSTAIFENMDSEIDIAAIENDARDADINVGVENLVAELPNSRDPNETCLLNDEFTVEEENPVIVVLDSQPPSPSLDGDEEIDLYLTLLAKIRTEDWLVQ